MNSELEKDLEKLLRILLDERILWPLFWFSGILLGVSATLLGIIKVGTIISDISTLKKYIEFLVSLEVASQQFLKSLVICIILLTFRAVSIERIPKNLLTLLAIISVVLFAFVLAFLASATWLLYNAIEILPNLSI